MNFFRRAVVWIVLLVCAAAAQQTADIEQRVNSILSRMTLEEKIDYIGGVNDFYIRPIPRLKIPELKMADGPLGVRNYGLSTAYPGGTALAATWDPDLVELVGESIGREARARGVHIMLGPGLNIYRAPMAGRDFEYYGEDPYLASRMAVAWIRGVQSQGVMATAKHFAANNQEYDRHNVSSDVDERTLREIYLPAFEAAVREAHVGALMDSYNPLNGVHATQNGHLNSEIAKKDWGFDGVIMSDWGATYDGVAAAKNGLDLEMPSAKFMNRANLLPAIRDGRVSEAEIDDHVRRILRQAIRFGFFDREQQDLSIPNWNPQARKIALEAAAESLVLLKNDQLLPLSKPTSGMPFFPSGANFWGPVVHSIAVIGPDAHPAVTQGGGSAHVNPMNTVSFLQGIGNELGEAAKVYYSPGAPDMGTAIIRTAFSTASSGGENGLKGEYFNNPNLEGTPSLTRTDRRINFRWPNGYAAGAPLDFSVRWTGYFDAPAAGEYRVWIMGEHLFRLFVDDKPVVDRWAPSETTRETSIVVPISFAAAGAHAVRLEEHSTRRGWLSSVETPSIAMAILRAEDAVPADTVKMAAAADAAIVCVGFNQRSESEGFDRTFALPEFQDDLVRAIAAANKRTIVVLTAGGSVDMNGWLDRVPALIHAWYPGQEGGTALAALLFGRFSPSGHLPASFERRWEDDPVHDSYYPLSDKRVEYKEGVFVGYRGYDRSQIKPLFPFGFGLSYTTFKYTNLTITPQATHDGKVTVQFSVTNTGSRVGSDVAQLYISDRHSHVPRPLKELKGFARVSLAPGQTKAVSITIDRRALSYYDVSRHDWTAEPGTFEVLIGRSSADIQLRGNFTLQ